MPKRRVEIERRAQYTRQRWLALETLASTRFAPIAEISSRACIYVTGSMARGEAMEGSDLDLFVIDRLHPDSQELTLVENSHLVARLDQVRDDAGFRAFSRGGHFIQKHSFQSLVELIGDPNDDALNAFTARILLLLNSVPLLNPEAYQRARRQVLDSYWQAQAATNDFRPVMLINDIRRWWGVLCLNFERYNKPVVIDAYTAHSGSTRRLANLKLRYARLMAAYSPLLSLVAQSNPDGTLSRANVERLVTLTPIGRLEQIEDDVNQTSDARALASAVLDRYNAYLEVMNDSKENLLGTFSNDKNWHPIKANAYLFHDDIVKLFKAVGEGKVLYDYCII